MTASDGDGRLTMLLMPAESKDAPASPGAGAPLQHQQSPQAQQQGNTKSGVLMIRVVAAKGLALPPGVHLPDAILQAISSRPAGHGRVRESLQRKQMWWLPYIVLEFDKNEVLVDALGGELDSPVWHFKARL
jgi:serum/glucocorticoid-regulated kinase 2